MSQPNRILVIEDNPDNLELVRFLLEQAGFQVISAVDGLEGLEKARTQRPDLILLDMSLPELDGWHLAKQLKNAEETASIPIIALTAHTLPGDRRRALEAGCDGFISKPLNVARFASQIEEYLNRPNNAARLP